MVTLLDAHADPVHSPEAQPGNDFAKYRQTILGMVSDEQILSCAGEGDWRNLYKIPNSALRQRLSQALGKIERSVLGGVNAPEWTVTQHNLLVEVFARTIEATKRQERKFSR